MSKSNNVLFAAVTGFVAGLLLAPKSGAETREDIKEKSREAKALMDEKTTETMDVLKTGASRAEKEVNGMVESAKQSARNVTGEVNSLAREARDRGNRVSQEAKQPIKKD